MSGIRWTEEELRAYQSRLGSLGSLDADRLSAPRRERAAAPAAPKARGGSSPLEQELAGHLSVMQLRPEQQFRFHPERKWRLDFAFPDVRVGVEIDGGIFAAENREEAGKHARGAGRCADMEKRNAAVELGWLILNYGPPHVRSGEAAIQIERLVLRLRRGDKLLKQQEL